MKKLALTLAIVLGLSMSTFADGGGLFQRGTEPEQKGVYGTRGGGFPGMPGHGGTGNEISLDLDHLNKGAYYISIELNGNKLIKKVIVK